MVKIPPFNTGDAGSIPGQGTKIPHATGQLSPSATTTELTWLNKRARVLQTTEPTCPGARVPQLERNASRRCAVTKIPHVSRKLPRAATNARCSPPPKKKRKERDRVVTFVYGVIFKRALSGVFIHNISLLL